MVEGVPHFSITGATKTLYGNTGGESLRSLRAQLAKTSGHQNPVTAVDLSDFPGISPVTIEADGTKTGRVREALAMNQDTFLALIELYRGKDSKAGRYASSLGSRLSKVAADMKTATKVVQLPGLGLNAYEVDGRPYVSMSEIVKATRNNDDTRPLTKWLSGAALPSDVNGSQRFSQGDSGAAFDCNVPHQSGSKMARLFSPQVAWHWVLHDLSSTKAAIVERALKLVRVIGAMRSSQSSF